jgi:hypothetical protein
MIDILWTDASGATQAVTVISIDHDHVGAAEPTDSPVEDGSDITDHIRAKQREFSATCFVSDTLIEAAATQMGGATEVTSTVESPSGKGFSVVSFSAPIQRVKLVYEALDSLRVGRRTCTIVTPLRRYESMCLTNLSFPVTNTDGVTFTLSAREIQIATTQTSAAPVPRQTRGHRRANVGTQPSTTLVETTGPSAPPEEPASRSGAAGILDSFL